MGSRAPALARLESQWRGLIERIGAHRSELRDLHERDRARQRLVITLVLALASVWAAYDGGAAGQDTSFVWAVPAMLFGYALVTHLYQRNVLKNGSPGLLGLYGFMALDSIITVLALVGAPQILAPFYSVLMVQMVRCGMRYGLPTLWLSWSAAALASAVLMPLSTFWRAETALLSSFVVMMVITPVLFGPFVKSLHKASNDLRCAADTDVLTGLANRRALASKLREARERSARNSTVLAVMLFDLDNFKRVNDNLGHGTGDRLLMTVADVLRKGFRSGEFIARLGGDEFVVLMEGMPVQGGVAKARERATQLVAQIEASAQIVAPDMEVSASAGVYCLKAATGDTSGDAVSTDTDLLTEADRAMYGCKRAGKGRVSVTVSLAELAESAGLKMPEIVSDSALS